MRASARRRVGALLPWGGAGFGRGPVRRSGFSGCQDRLEVLLPATHRAQEFAMKRTGWLIAAALASIGSRVVRGSAGLPGNGEYTAQFW